LLSSMNVLKYHSQRDQQGGRRNRSWCKYHQNANMIGYLCPTVHTCSTNTFSTSQSQWVGYSCVTIWILCSGLSSTWKLFLNFRSFAIRRGWFPKMIQPLFLLLISSPFNFSLSSCTISKQWNVKQHFQHFAWSFP
jgi:hypothetical protein